MAKPVLIEDVSNWCDGCESSVIPEGAPVVQVGQEPDYDNRTANLCYRCLLKAIDVITAPPETKK